MSNVETLANLPFLQRHGAAAFRVAGHVGVAGHVPRDHHRRGPARPLSTRLPHGLPFTELLALHGVSADQVRGVLMGGYFAGLLNRDVLDTTLDHETMRRLGSGLGCGAIVDPHRRLPGRGRGVGAGVLRPRERRASAGRASTAPRRCRR